MTDRLRKWLSGQIGRPFSWGDLDCSTFVLLWLEACSGERAIDDVRGQYTSETEAQIFALRHGRDLEEILLGAGARAITEADLVPGDVVLVKDTRRPWWRGHVIVDQDTFASCWPGRGVRAAHRVYLRGGVRRFLRLPIMEVAPCPQ